MTYFNPQEQLTLLMLFFFSYVKKLEMRSQATLSVSGDGFQDKRHKNVDADERQLSICGRNN